MYKWRYCQPVSFDWSYFVSGHFCLCPLFGWNCARLWPVDHSELARTAAAGRSNVHRCHKSTGRDLYTIAEINKFMNIRLICKTSTCPVAIEFNAHRSFRIPLRKSKVLGWGNWWCYWWAYSHRVLYSQDSRIRYLKWPERVSRCESHSQRFQYGSLTIAYFCTPAETRCRNRCRGKCVSAVRPEGCPRYNYTPPSLRLRTRHCEFWWTGHWILSSWNLAAARVCRKPVVLRKRIIIIIIISIKIVRTKINQINLISLIDNKMRDQDEKS